MTARAWAAFAGVSVLWGVPYYFIKVCVDDGMPPVFLVWVRVLLAGLLLLALAARAGVLGQLRGRWAWVVAYTVLEVCIPFPLIAEGERHVSSSLAAILVAAVPLWVALLALRFDHSERLTGRRLAGLLVGLGGVVALVGIDVAGNADELLGAAAVLVAALGYAAGPMLLNVRLRGVDMRAVMAASLLVAAAILTPWALADPPAAMPGGGAIASLATLVVACTAVAFTLFGALIAMVGPGRAAVITYVAPVVAVALGVVAAGERPGPGALLGLVLIAAGSWLGTRADAGRPSGDARPVAPRADLAG
ncbi:MAG TPA: DMT family transporter [Solirubrobacteraceae bacterium]|nr:DMT family transporter [Solirubrobacteraceae bacterium]